MRECLGGAAPGQPGFNLHPASARAKSAAYVETVGVHVKTVPRVCVGVHVITACPPVAGRGCSRRLDTYTRRVSIGDREPRWRAGASRAPLPANTDSIIASIIASESDASRAPRCLPAGVARQASSVALEGSGLE